ncbi:MAG: shikimate dehydrogenase [Bacteroidetes bacterium]|nr:MAG: shikimate dehydrogenase [Bacteroidota bacterium]PIE87758.1 MAG: shikimate dehydrogenase [Bacteroidota bacterium]
MAQYGLIGRSLTHSFSPAFFNNFFQREGLSHTYDCFELAEASAILDLVHKMPDLRGVNVTIPYKQTIIPFLDTLSAEAKHVKAVNTVVIQRDAHKITLHGHNTDTYGFQKILEQQGNHFHHALVLGTGGAAHAICHVLQKSHIPYISVSRKAQPTLQQRSYEELTPTLSQEIDLVINTTPVGMFPHTEAMPPLPSYFLRKGVTVIDLIYNPPKTQLLTIAEKQGCQIINGWGMLEEQAKKAWKIWNKE